MKYLILLLAITASAQDYTIKSVIDTLAKVESDGRTKVIGDNGQAVGLLQIHPIMVDECNRLAGSKKFTLADRFNAKKSRYMATIYLSHQINRYKRLEGVYPDELLLANSWNMGSIFAKQNLKYRVRYRTKKEI